VVEVTGRDQLGWHVPRTVYTTHRTWAEDEGYKSHARAVEDAMRAYIDADDLAEIEDRLNDILATLPSNDGAKKIGPGSPGSHAATGPTQKVQLRVDADLRATFAGHVREQFDTRPGVALGHALQEHHDTGGRNRRQRIHDRLDAIEATVEGMEATGQDKVGAIADQLGESFRLSEFLSAVEAVGVTTKKYAIKKFLPDVLGRTETVPHPGNPKRFIPQTAKSAPDHPNPANLPYYAMTDDEKRVGIQVAAIRKAWSNGGRARLTVAEGVDALAGVGSPRHKTVRAAMCDAEQRAEAFGYDSDEDALTVHTDALDTTSEAVTVAAEERARENGDTASSKAGETDATPRVEPDDSGENDPGTDADGRMDALMNATPVADGDGE